MTAFIPSKSLAIRLHSYHQSHYPDCIHTIKVTSQTAIKTIKVINNQTAFIPSKSLATDCNSTIKVTSQTAFIPSKSLARLHSYYQNHEPDCIPIKITSQTAFIPSKSLARLHSYTIKVISQTAFLPARASLSSAA